MAFFVEISLKKQRQILNHMVWRSNIVWFCRRHNKVENQSVDIERLCVCAYVESKAFLESHKTATAYYGFWTNFDISIFLFFLFIYLFFNFHFYRIYDDKLTHSVYLFRSLFYYIYRVHLRIFQYTNAHSVWYSENLAYLSNFRTATICEIVLCSTHINENNDNNDDVNDGIGNVKYACLAHTFYFKFKIISILGLLASSLSLGWQENERWKQ